MTTVTMMSPRTEAPMTDATMTAILYKVQDTRQMSWRENHMLQMSLQKPLGKLLWAMETLYRQTGQR